MSVGLKQFSTPQYQIPGMPRSERAYQKIRDVMSILNGIQWKADDEDEEDDETASTGEEATTPLNDNLSENERYEKSVNDAKGYTPEDADTRYRRLGGNMQGYSEFKDKEQQQQKRTPNYGKTIMPEGDDTFGVGWFTLGGDTPADGNPPTYDGIAEWNANNGFDWNNYSADEIKQLQKYLGTDVDGAWGNKSISALSKAQQADDTNKTQREIIEAAGLPWRQ